MGSNKAITPLRKLAIKITCGITVFSPILMSIILFFIPKPMRETVLYAIYFIVMENVLLLAILYFQSKFINIVSYPALFIIAIVGMSFVTTNRAIVGVASLISMVLTPTLFLIAPLLIIILGIKSIREKETLIKMPGMPAGVRLKSTKGSDAVGWGFVYVIVGTIFLLMVLSGLMYASCGNSVSGLCVFNQSIETSFVTSTKILGQNPQLSLTIIAALVSGIYSLILSFKKH